MSSSTTYVNINQGAGSSTAYNCLTFPGPVASPQSGPYVNCGTFWDYNKNLGNSGYFDFVARNDGSGYLIVDGDGGNHAVLLGLNGGSGLSGNFYASDGAIYPTGSFSVALGPATGEWAHHSASIETQSASQVALITRWNGLVTGRFNLWTIASGKQRASVPAGNAAGPLYIGAGSHDNFTGKVAWVRMFDRANPLGTFMQPSIPPRVPGTTYLTTDQASLVLSFAGASQPIVPDVSGGYDQGTAANGRYQHPGTVTNWFTGQVYPSWTYDSTCPVGVSGDVTNTVGRGGSGNPVTKSLPSGSPRIFDGFNRAPTDYFWTPSGPTFGVTDSRASLGSLTWVQHMVGGDDLSNWTVPTVGKAWAIQSCMARCYEYQPCVAYVDNGQANMDVRITRNNTSDLGMTSIVMRLQDRNNFQCLTTLGANNGATNKDIYMMTVSAGSNTRGLGTSWSPTNASWTTLRGKWVGDVLTVYVDDGAGGWETLAPTITDSTFNTATKAGIVQGGALFGGTGGAHWNGTDFTVI